MGRDTVSDAYTMATAADVRVGEHLGGFPVTAADAKLQALVILGRQIGKVPWCADTMTRSAADALLKLYGITVWETRREALERTRSKEKEE